MSKYILWKNLSCELTQDEVSKYSQELARITGEQSEIEAQKKEVMSDFAAKLNKCVADGRVLARKIITKKEDRQVECDLEFDFKAGLVYTVRTDTGVTIDQRKLSDDERQEKLDFDGEEDRRQAAEEKREAEAAPAEAPAEPEPDTTEPETDGEPGGIVCTVATCPHFSSTEPNGCSELEYVEECERGADGEAVAEAEPDPTTLVGKLTLGEYARRDEICKDWRFCDYKEPCFTPENEVAGICFKDEPHRMAETAPVAVDPEQVNRIVGTSSDDCKNTLQYIYDLGVLHEALERCTVNDEKTKAKYISSRINQLSREVAA